MAGAMGTRTIAANRQSAVITIHSKCGRATEPGRSHSLHDRTGFPEAADRIEDTGQPKHTHPEHGANSAGPLLPELAEVISMDCVCGANASFARKNWLFVCLRGARDWCAPRKGRRSSPEIRTQLVR